MPDASLSSKSSSSNNLPFTIDASFYASIVCVMVYAAICLLGFSLLLRNFFVTRAALGRIARIKSHLIKSRIRGISRSSAASSIAGTPIHTATAAGAASGAPAAAPAASISSLQTQPKQSKNIKSIKRSARFSSPFISNPDESDQDEGGTGTAGKDGYGFDGDEDDADDISLIAAEEMDSSESLDTKQDDMPTQKPSKGPRWARQAAQKRTTSIVVVPKRSSARSVLAVPTVMSSPHFTSPKSSSQPASSGKKRSMSSKSNAASASPAATSAAAAMLQNATPEAEPIATQGSSFKSSKPVHRSSSSAGGISRMLGAAATAPMSFFNDKNLILAVLVLASISRCIQFILVTFVDVFSIWHSLHILVTSMPAALFLVTQLLLVCMWAEVLWNKQRADGSSSSSSSSQPAPFRSMKPYFIALNLVIFLVLLVLDGLLIFQFFYFDIHREQPSDRGQYRYTVIEIITIVYVALLLAATGIGYIAAGSSLVLRYARMRIKSRQVRTTLAKIGFVASVSATCLLAKAIILLITIWKESVLYAWYMLLLYYCVLEIVPLVILLHVLYGMSEQHRLIVQRSATYLSSIAVSTTAQSDLVAEASTLSPMTPSPMEERTGLLGVGGHDKSTLAPYYYGATGGVDSHVHDNAASSPMQISISHTHHHHVHDRKKSSDGQEQLQSTQAPAAASSPAPAQAFHQAQIRHSFGAPTLLRFDPATNSYCTSANYSALPGESSSPMNQMEQSSKRLRRTSDSRPMNRSAAIAADAVLARDHN